MIISFLGLSGCGKSRWSKRIALEYSYRSYCCDDRIEEHLAQKQLLGEHTSIHGVAEWMGQPYSSGYSDREASYLRAEFDVVNGVIDEITKNPTSAVIDCSGSIVYLDEGICRQIQKLSIAVHLEVPQNKQEEMFQLYLKEPKPVVWGKQYWRGENESERDALRRCYPELMHFREQLYRQYATVTLPFEFHRMPGLAVTDFLKEIERQYEVHQHQRP